LSLNSVQAQSVTEGDPSQSKSDKRPRSLKVKVDAIKVTSINNVDARQLKEGKQAKDQVEQRESFHWIFNHYLNYVHVGSCINKVYLGLNVVQDPVD
jgi:hypothetical protein